MQIASGSLGVSSSAWRQLIFTMSNGNRVVLYIGADGWLTYVTSPDGVAWSAGTHVPSGNTLDIHPVYGIVLNDVIYLWYSTTANAGAGVPHNVRCVLLTYNPGTDAIVQTDHIDFTSGPILTSMPLLAVKFANDRFHVAYIGVTSANSHILGIFSTPANGAIETQTVIPWIFNTISGLDVGVSSDGSKVFYVMVDDSHGGMSLIAATWAAEVYSIPSGALSEFVASMGAVSCLGVAVDPLDKLDIVYNLNGELSAIKRQSANSYSSQIPLYAGAYTAAGFDMLQAASGDLYIVFQSNVNGSEIYGLTRQGGTWGTVKRLVSSPAEFPTTNHLLDIAEFDLLYVTQVGLSPIEYVQIIAASPPGAPSNIKPNGLIGQLAPTATWDYNNPGLPNPQGFAQTKWYDMSTPLSPALLWDSGKVADGDHAMTYAGPLLAYNTPLGVQVQTWDSLTNAGAGTASGFSAISTFQIKQPPVVTITDLISAGITVTNGGTATNRNIVADGHVTQPDGDTLSGYVLRIYNQTMQAVVASLPLTTFPTPIASGSDFTTNSLNASTLATGTIYNAVLTAIDSVTGVSADSSPLEFEFLLPPAANATSFVCTPIPELGVDRAVWVNPPNTARNLLDWRRSGDSEWRPSYDGPAVETWDVHAPCLINVDIRLRVIDTNGSISSGVIDPGLVIPVNGDLGSVWFTRTDDLTYNVCLGNMDDFSATGFTLQQDIASFTPMGRTSPVTSFGMAEWRSAKGLKYWIPAYAVDAAGVAHQGLDVCWQIDKLVRAQVPVWFRDPRGIAIFATITNVLWEVDDPGVHFHITLDVDQVDYSGSPL